MANDMSVGTSSYSPSAAPAIKIKQPSLDASDVSTQAASSAVQSIQTTSELQKAVLSGDPVTLGDAQVIKTIERANKALVGRSTTFEFSVHKDTSLISIKVIDKDTGEVIREIPPDKTLDMVKKMWELAGMLVDEKR